MCWRQHKVLKVLRPLSAETLDVDDCSFVFFISLTRYGDCVERFLCHAYLHCDKSVIHHDFFCQEIGTYCGFILVAELLIHILIHQWGLPNSEMEDKNKSLFEKKKKLWRWWNVQGSEPSTRILLPSIAYPESPRIMTLSSTFFLDVIARQL